MGRVVAIKIPTWAIPPGVKADAKAAMTAAAERRLEPAFEGLDGAGRIERIRLDAVADDYLARMERLHVGVPKGRICAGLVAAYYRAGGDQAGGPSVDRLEILAAARGFEPRVAQRRLYSDVARTLNEGGIGFHEASTGTGKTLAVLAAALDRIAQGKRAVYAVPTIGLVDTLDADLRELAAAGVELPRWRAVYGRREFVSVSAARARLSEAFDAELQTLIAAAEETGDWRLASWQRKAPHMLGLSTCTVSELTPADDPGVLAYRAQFAAGEADLLVCTHAMLAIDVVLRRMRASGEEDFREARDAAREEREGYDYRIENLLRAGFEREEHRHLPHYHVAFVDEAHLLEQAFASAMAVDISLWQLLRALRALREVNPRAVPTEAVEIVSRAFDRLKPEEGEDADSRLIGNDAPEAREFGRVQKALTTVKETLKHCDRVPEAREFVKRARESLQAFLRDGAAVAMLSYSPSKRFPRLLLGRKTTHREMHYLWTTMEAGALVSATLNVVTATGEASASMARYLLNVPHDRARYYAPIVNEQIYRPVTCFTPAPAKAREGWLVRPAGDDEGAYDTWMDQLADPLLRMAQTAAGGSLVLTTSYRAIEALETRMRDVIGGRLIVSSPDRRLADIADQFLDAAALGRRPVWIATGGAFTGLDLSGVRRGFEAAEDDVLTDLAVTNIPFRTNRSLSHASRVLRGGNFEFFDTYVKTKQGIGRLVRNPDPRLKANRRLWILDGRLHHLATRGRMASFLAMLRPYRQENFG